MGFYSNYDLLERRVQQLKKSKGELMWLACSCAVTIGESYFIQILVEDATQEDIEGGISVLEGHINGQCILNNLDSKDSDYVLEHGVMFFKDRIVNLINAARKQ